MPNNNHDKNDKRAASEFQYAIESIRRARGEAPSVEGISGY
jgi:hypothetical protein